MSIDFSQMRTLTDQRAEAESQFAQRLAAIRWDYETGGVTLDGGRVAATSREAQMTISNALQHIHAGLIPLPISWKLMSGWETLDADGVEQIAMATLAHVQRAFAAEHAAMDAHNAGSTKTAEELFQEALST